MAGHKCVTRHLKIEHLALISSIIGAELDYKAAGTALRQAEWVYRRYNGSCLERRLREAVQLVIDIVGLRVSSEKSPLVAVTAALTFLEMNSIAIASVSPLINLAVGSCKGYPDPEEAVESLKEAISSFKPRAFKSPLQALQRALAMLVQDPDVNMGGCGQSLDS